MKLTLAVATVLATTMTAGAFSGAEFLKADPSFAKGFAWGALEYRLSVARTEDVEKVRNMGDCFSSAGVNSEVFYGAVRSYIDANLSALTAPAIAAVLKTSLEMCPWQD